MQAMLHDHLLVWMSYAIAFLSLQPSISQKYISRPLLCDGMGLRPFEIPSNTNNDCFMFYTENDTTL